MNEDDLQAGGLSLPEALLGYKQVKHYEQVIKVTIHHYYLTGEIEDESDKYIDMMHTMMTAEPHDKIFLHINTPGGDLNSTVAIIAAMKASDAEITTIIEGEACSGGTFIFLAGDNYIVNDYSAFLIHNYTHGPYGKGAEVANRVKFSEDHYKELCEGYYTGFLTDDELEQVLDDKDFWMTSKEIKERLRNQGTGELIDFSPDDDEVEVPVKVKAGTTNSRPKKKPPAKKKKAAPRKKSTR